jgi:pilus assembly protein Flp/PilA
VFKFFKDESGATAIEYGLIAAAIGLVLVTVLDDVASGLDSTFTSIAGHLG